MAKKNFQSILEHEFKEEGGYVDHPSDPGGATNMGITRAVLAQWRGVSPVTALPKSEVKNLTKAEAAKIYTKNYWNVVKGDDLPSGVDAMVMDFGVNSGPSRAVKYLQALVGVAQDGVMGPKTLAAVNAVKDVPSLVNKYMDKREGFLKGLKTFPTFGKGWLARTSRTRKLALELAGKPVQADKPSVPSNGSSNLLVLLVRLLRAIFGGR